MREQNNKEFKAKVALEAIHGEKTIQEISMLYQVHPNLNSRPSTKQCACGFLFAVCVSRSV